MTRRDAIIQQALAHAKALAARYGQPQRVNLSLYQSDHDLHTLRPEDGPEATAAEQRLITETVATELRKRGWTVFLLTWQTR